MIELCPYAMKARAHSCNANPQANQVPAISDGRSSIFTSELTPLHLPSTPTRHPSSIHTRPATSCVMSGQQPCRYFASPNGCRAGDVCRFSHAPPQHQHHAYQQPQSQPPQPQPHHHHQQHQQHHPHHPHESMMHDQPPPQFSQWGYGGGGGPNVNVPFAGGRSERSSTSSATSSSAPCTFFQQGRCTRGNECRFSHEAVSPMSSAPGGYAGSAPHTPTGPGGLVFQADGSGPSRVRSPPPTPHVVDVDEVNLFSIDVECVATGTQHDDRAIAQIALVDAAGAVRVNL